jgi:hypothetical protein
VLLGNLPRRLRNGTFEYCPVDEALAMCHLRPVQVYIARRRRRIPLSRISEVLKTNKSDTILLPSMVTNIGNSGLWFAYGVAPQINDPFIYGPCGLGLVFGLSK